MRGTGMGLAGWGMEGYSSLESGCFCSLYATLCGCNFYGVSNVVRGVLCTLLLKLLGLACTVRATRASQGQREHEWLSMMFTSHACSVRDTSLRASEILNEALRSMSEQCEKPCHAWD